MNDIPEIVIFLCGILAWFGIYQVGQIFGIFL